MVRYRELVERWDTIIRETPESVEDFLESCTRDTLLGMLREARGANVSEAARVRLGAAVRSHDDAFREVTAEHSRMMADLNARDRHGGVSAPVSRGSLGGQVAMAAPQPEIPIEGAGAREVGDPTIPNDAEAVLGADGDHENVDALVKRRRAQ